MTDNGEKKEGKGNASKECAENMEKAKQDPSLQSIIDKLKKFTLEEGAKDVSEGKFVDNLKNGNQKPQQAR